MLQGDKEFDIAESKYKEARAEDNAFNTAHAEENAATERSQRAGNMAGYATETANDPEEAE